jgi:hypothetical protein
MITCIHTHEALSRHLVSNADKVLLTAPGKGVPNIVHGVNHNEYNPMKSIFLGGILHYKCYHANLESQPRESDI